MKGASGTPNIWKLRLQHDETGHLDPFDLGVICGAAARR